ncbi:MAG: insulinase family protein [Clostridia bacterium]|nr:insulinase family protein [Clostridia bacterium]
MKKILLRKISALFIVVVFLAVSLALPYNSVYAASVNTIPAAEYQISKVYSGFKLISSKSMPDLNSTVMMFSHVKTGARLMFVKNNDNERSFSISFRTPTTDDTGVNHIIEHSVLNGSKNYPSKSPFAEMLKRSLGTFINAMTSSDFTIYPVSSVNETDLKNLMGVYLDAVFYPNLHTEQNIFNQEAWRYTLDSKDSKLSINGIVYNEMKGNYSNSKYVLDKEITKSLLSESSYKWDAGGNPEAIPTLTWDKLKAVHKKYYTPSNSYIYLYGNLDIGKYLEFIDKNYLSKFSKVTTDSSIKSQKAFKKAVEKVAFYPVPSNESLDRKTYLALNFVTGTITDKELMTGMDYLSYLLMGSESSPLKKALQDSGIADNITYSFSNDSLQPVLSFIAENSDESSKTTFKKVITDTLNKVVKTGFSKDLINQTFAQYDLSKRIQKISSMKGLSININIMKQWVHDTDPTIYMNNSDSEAKIRKLADKKYFENLINKYLLSNTHSSLVILKPSAGMEEKNEKTRSEKLENYKKKLDAKAISALIKGTENFKAWQDKPDSAEALAKIPRLSVKDIKPELPDLTVNTEKLSGVEVLSHTVPLNGVSSINMYFDTSRVPQDKLHYMNLLASLLGNLDTKKYKQEDLSNIVNLYSSGIYFGASVATNSKNPDLYKPVMAVSLLTLNNNVSKSLELTEEIINNTVFTNKAKIKQIIQQNKMYMQQMYASGSGMYSSLKLQAYFSEAGRYIENLMGPGYYTFLRDIEKNFDKNSDEIVKNLQETYSSVFNKNGLIASHSGDASGYTAFKSNLEKIISKVNSEELSVQTYKFDVPDKNLALPLPVKVQTVIQGGDFSKENYKYSGKMLVLQKILNMEYLWKSIRTSGGAYGFNIDFSPNGLMSIMSIRDPNLSETLEAFKGAVKFLKEFNPTEDEMENFVIGTISEFLKIKSMGPLYEGSICDNLYLSGLTASDMLTWMNEVLDTKAEDIRGYAEMLDKVVKQDVYYVEGSKEKIEENKDLFTRLDSIGK